MSWTKGEGVELKGREREQKRLNQSPLVSNFEYFEAIRGLWCRTYKRPLLSILVYLEVERNSAR